MTRIRRPLTLIAAFTLGTLLGLPAAGSAGSAAVVFHGPRDTHRVALTFDDGWSQANCRAIAETLRVHHVAATFFINGAHFKRAPNAWRTILAGFEVANHTWGHVDLTDSPDWLIAKQIRTAERMQESVLERPIVKVLRPPYGAWDRRLPRIAASLGYHTILIWDVSAADTSHHATVTTVIRNATRGGNGAVVLMHCGPDVTPPAVDSIIHHYRRAGYELVTVSTLLDLPQVAEGPPIG